MRYRLRHGAGLLLTTALHIGLLGVLLSRRSLPELPQPQAGAIQWLRMAPPKIAKQAPPLLPPKPAKLAQAALRTIPATPHGTPAGTVPETAASAGPGQEVQAVPAERAPDPGEFFQGDLSAAPELSADEMLRIAKRDVAKIDQELRKKSLHRIKPPDDSVRARLDRSFQDAKDAKANWYDAPTITEISVPGGPGGGSRVYEVKMGGLRYCIYVPAPGGPTRYMTCPRK